MYYNYTGASGQCFNVTTGGPSTLADPGGCVNGMLYPLSPPPLTVATAIAVVGVRYRCLQLLLLEAAALLWCLVSLP